ncbi:uncharacterized protein LOC121857078 [Homarus americanus]|uniref:uncharacterized protein LOC121857078 n=1 Tax=Homarus americanus TaxID=6706 RepID=UPI001C4443D5|nr:uncharacterized protein LOC121857078 [Homarus americanus]
MPRLLVLVLVIVVAQVTEGQQKQEYLETANYPEGYYAFEEAPSKTPPKVRKPPYLQSKVPCPGTLETKAQMEQSLDNLCGDLNDGLLPLNPMGQDILGHSYPFDLIKNKTLDFFSKTLPILKEDKTLPKVAKLRSRNVPLRDQFRVIRRPIRSAEDETPASQKPDTEKEMTQKVKDLLEGKLEGRSLGFDDDFQGRGARAFCADNWGLFCLLFNAMSGKSSSGTMAQDRNDDDFEGSLNSLVGGGMQPLTPCPSAVEYITPVFARNYQGVWRYVVQIPYEGYFTQTVEVTQCLSSKCHYLSGACLASPRWVSLLVAEVYYPDALFPGTPARPDLSRAAVASNNPPSSRYQQRQGNSPALREEPPAPHYCDGQDEIGCYQVRLYYDWFLIPGSCKCWKQDYFAQFAYRK